MISSGGMPLALFLLLRGYRRSSRGLVHRRLAGVRVAGQPRLHARAAVRYLLASSRCSSVALVARAPGADPAANAASSGSVGDAGAGTTAAGERPSRGPIVARRVLGVTLMR